MFPLGWAGAQTIIELLFRMALTNQRWRSTENLRLFDELMLFLSVYSFNDGPKIELDSRWSSVCWRHSNIYEKRNICQQKCGASARRHGDYFVFVLPARTSRAHVFFSCWIPMNDGGKFKKKIILKVWQQHQQQQQQHKWPQRHSECKSTAIHQSSLRVIYM